MLANIRNTTTTRISELRFNLNTIKHLEPSSSPDATNSIRTLKGLFFVHMYGVWELTVSSLITRTVEIINSRTHTINQCKPTFLTLALDSYFNSYTMSGIESKWLKKIDLMKNIESNDILILNQGLDPAGGKNIKKEQLDLIWSAFAISTPNLPDLRFKGRLTELVDNRNAIAHGRESPQFIGGRFTTGDLEQRFNDLNLLCTYTINQFDNYLTNQDYLR